MWAGELMRAGEGKGEVSVSQFIRRQRWLSPTALARDLAPATKSVFSFPTISTGSGEFPKLKLR